MGSIRGGTGTGIGRRRDYGFPRGRGGGRRRGGGIGMPGPNKRTPLMLQHRHEGLEPCHVLGWTLLRVVRPKDGTHLLAVTRIAETIFGMGGRGGDRRTEGIDAVPVQIRRHIAVRESHRQIIIRTRKDAGSANQGIYKIYTTEIKW